MTNATALQTNESRLIPAPLLRAVAWTTLAVGLLDATDGVVYFGLTARLNPIQVLQFIASGAMGKAAYTGGVASAAVGLGFHFLIAAVVSALFVGAYQMSAAIRTNWWSIGLAYGVAVWLVMNLIVLPNSAIGAAPLNVLSVIHGLVGHALCVGLAAAWTTRRALGR